MTLTPELLAEIEAKVNEVRSKEAEEKKGSEGLSLKEFAGTLGNVVAGQAEGLVEQTEKTANRMVARGMQAGLMSMRSPEAKQRDYEAGDQGLPTSHKIDKKILAERGPDWVRPVPELRAAPKLSMLEKWDRFLYRKSVAYGDKWSKLVNGEELPEPMKALVDDADPGKETRIKAIQEAAERSDIFDSGTLGDLTQRLVFAFANNLSVAGAYSNPYTRFTVLPDMMWQENVQAAKQLAEANELTYNAEDFLWSNTASTAINGGLEMLEMKIIFGRFKNKAAKQNLRKQFVSLAMKSKSKAVRSYLGGIVMDAGSSFLQEASQQGVTDLFANMQIIKRAEDEGRPVLYTQEERDQVDKDFASGKIDEKAYRNYVRIKTKEEIGASVVKAGRQGLSMVGLPVIVNAPRDINNIRRINKAGKAVEAVEGTVDSWKKTEESIQEYENLSLDEQNTALRKELESSTLDSLLTQAKKMGMAIGNVEPGVDLRTALTDFIMENNYRVPAFREGLYQNFLDRVEADENTSLAQKNLIKWMTQTDLDRTDVVMLSMVMQGVGKNMGYDSWNEFLEQKSSLTGKSDVTFEQMGERDAVAVEVAKQMGLLDGEAGEEVFKYNQIIRPENFSNIDVMLEAEKKFPKTKVRNQQGRIIPVFHGTGGPVKDGKFDKNLRGSMTGAADAAFGFFFTSSETVAESYSVAARPEDSVTSQVGAYYLNLEDPLVVDMGGALYKDVANEMYSRIKDAKLVGQDGVIFKNIQDSMILTDMPSTTYVAFNENQIKSADDIVTDAKGEVVPLGQRFDKKSPYIYKQTKGQTQSGADIILGQTRFLAESKFVIDLFKGADILTLAHEFGHAISPFLPESVIDTIIQQFVKNDFAKGMDDESQDDFIAKAKKAWLYFVDGNTNPFTTAPEGEMATLLRGTQEYLAEQFQTYLSNPKNMPMKSLAPAFKMFAENLAQHYTNSRYEGMEVDTKIAAVFDRLIANGDLRGTKIDYIRTLPDLPKRTIKIEGQEYSLYESKPRSIARRKLLAYAQKAYADIGGLKQHVQEYLDTTLSRKQQKDGAIVGALAELKTHKDAIKVMDAVDKLLFKEQNRERKKMVREIKALASRASMKQLSPEAAAKIKQALHDIDLSKPNKKSMAGLQALSEYLEEQVGKEGGVDINIFDIPLKELSKLSRLHKMNVWDMTFEELNMLHASIAAVSQESRDIEAKRVAAWVRKQDLVAAGLNKELDKSKRLDKKMRRHLTAKEERITSKFKQKNRPGPSFMAVWNNNYRMLSASRIPTLERLASELKAAQLEYDKVLSSLEDLLEQAVPLHVLKGTSSHAFKAKPVKIPVLKTVGAGNRSVGRDAITIRGNGKNKRVYANSELQISKAELMMLYGQSLNEKGSKHLFDGGFVDESDPGTVYHIPGGLPAFYTLVDTHLSAEEKQVVHRLIAVLETVKERGDVISKEMLGYSLFIEENYLPLHVSSSDKANTKALSLNKLNPQTHQFVAKMLTDMKLIHKRTDSSAPLVLTDIFAAVGQNVLDTSFFLTLMKPLVEFQNIVLGDKGAENGRYSKMQELFGSERMSRMERWVLEVGDRSSDADKAYAWLGKWNAVVKSGILAGRLITALKQFVSRPLILNYGITHANYALAQAKRIVGPGQLGVLPKYTMEELGAMHPSFRRRYRDTVDIDLRDDYKTANVKKMFLAKKYGGNKKFYMMTAADANVASFILECFETQYGNTWSREKVVEEALNVVLMTQANFYPILSSNFMTDTNPILKLFHGAFHSQLDAIRGEYQYHWESIQNNMAEGESLFDNKGHVAAIVRTAWVSIFAEQLLSEVFNMVVRGKMPPEDEDEIKKWTDKLAIRFLTNAVSILPVLGPVAKSFINSMMKQWGSEAPSSVLYETIVDMGSQVSKVLTSDSNGEEKEDGQRVQEFIELLLKIDRLRGGAAYNIYDQVMYVPERAKNIEESRGSF